MRPQPAWCHLSLYVSFFTVSWCDTIGDTHKCSRRGWRWLPLEAVQRLAPTHSGLCLHPELLLVKKKPPPHSLWTKWFWCLVNDKKKKTQLNHRFSCHACVHFADSSFHVQTTSWAQHIKASVRRGGFHCIHLHIKDRDKRKMFCLRGFVVSVTCVAALVVQSGECIFFTLQSFTLQSPVLFIITVHMVQIDMFNLTEQWFTTRYLFTPLLN